MFPAKTFMWQWVKTLGTLRQPVDGCLFMFIPPNMVVIIHNIMFIYIYIYVYIFDYNYIWKISCNHRLWPIPPVFSIFFHSEGSTPPLLHLGGVWILPLTQRGPGARMRQVSGGSRAPEVSESHHDVGIEYIYIYIYKGNIMDMKVF